MDVSFGSFIWDPKKESLNIKKLGSDFTIASRAFKDRKRKIYTDGRHSLRNKGISVLPK